MQYRMIRKGYFLARPNRFIAHVELDGQIVICHVKNTGRCKELLKEGAVVYLEESDNSNRKTKFDLVAVEKGERLINMDSQAPNRVFQEWAEGGGFRGELNFLKAETTYGNSRFDFYWKSSNTQGFVEVKGVTLEENGVVLFPDAPTKRGVKHIEELIAAREAGYEAAICFVVQMACVRCFRPNDRTHPEFGDALRRAAQAGVEILAVDCCVERDSLKINGKIPVEL